MKFRKKPVVIDAVQFSTDGDFPLKDVMAFTKDLGSARLVKFGNDGNAIALVIETLEGDMTAIPGDWIIRGVKGEFYPCKPDIFAATYDPA